MKIENERKLLLRRIPVESKWYDRMYDIEQYYLEDDVRYRKYVDLTSGGIFDRDIRYERLKKTSTNTSEARIEYTDEITKEEYEKGIEDAVSYIHKGRYVIDKQDEPYKIELDYFINIRLIVCEVEIVTDKLSEDTIDELYSVELPEIIQQQVIMEVSDFDEFKNKNLAVRL